MAGHHGLSLNIGQAGESTGYLVASDTGDPNPGVSEVAPSNLWADLNGATPWTVNDLRLAFQTQTNHGTQ